MKTKIFYITLLLIFSSTLVSSQTITHPWWVVDQGGGKSTADTFALHASIGQPIIQMMAADTFTLESGFIPGLRMESGFYTVHEYQFAEGWNMVSVPLWLSDYRKSILFLTATSPAFGYLNSYEIRDTLRNGEGYWLKFPSDQTVNISGTSYMTDTIEVNARWNMIGTLYYPVLKADIEPIPPLVIQSNIFGYITGVGYFSEDTLESGYGYWIKVSEAGKLVVKTSSLLSQTASKTLVSNKKEKSAHHFATLANSMGLHELRITDADGKSSSLFFSTKHIKAEIGKFDLPPLPPADNFDIRFSSHRLAEVADLEKKDQVQKFPILINGVKDPIIISWNMDADENTYSLEVANAGEKIQKHLLKGNDKLVLNISKLLSLKLTMSSGSEVELPKHFALHQNYPNPFNPTTKIKYDLPRESKVSLKIYNLLGQEVLTLVDEIQDAGYKSVEWNASASGGLSSGVYIYKLSAETDGKSFADVKKMIMIK